MSSEKKSHNRNELVTSAVTSLCYGEGAQQLVCFGMLAAIQLLLRSTRLQGCFPSLTRLTCYSWLSFFSFFFFPIRRVSLFRLTDRKLVQPQPEPTLITGGSLASKPFRLFLFFFSCHKKNAEKQTIRRDVSVMHIALEKNTFLLHMSKCVYLLLNLLLFAITM